jgi:hypothetical protein
MEMKTIRRRAAKNTRPLFDRAIQYRRFPHPKLSAGDTEFYDQSRDELLQRGFILLGDLRDASAPRGSAIHKTPVRVLVDAKGTIMVTVAVVQFPIAERLRNELSGLPTDGTIDLETEFSDGRFILTSNAESAGLIDFPPQIDTRFFRAGTKIATLLREHRRRVRARLLAHPRLSVRTVSAVREYGESQARQGELKAQFKKKNGYVSEREVRRIAQRGTETALALQAALGDFLTDLAGAFQPPKKRTGRKKPPAKSARRKAS